MHRTTWGGQGVPKPPDSVAAIGVFDGVHVGHQALLSDTVALARSHGVEAAVLTFEPDPEAVLHPDAPPPRIVDPADRATLIAATGVDRFVEVPFDMTLADMEWDRFVSEILVPALSPVVLLVGEDFRFGRGGRGDVAALSAHGNDHGFEVVPVELVARGGRPVTSTRIRELVGSGSVAEAARLLERPYVLKGDVVPGRGVGSRLSAPTANVRPGEGMLVPGDGVYAAWAHTDEAGWHRAAVSVGEPPTFPEAAHAVEVHLIHEDRGPSPGESLRVAFVERLRALAAFPDEDSLVRAVADDIARVVSLLDDAPDGNLQRLY
jgi:riboflavin kinase/FMN adenylyltransferase